MFKILLVFSAICLLSSCNSAGRIVRPGDQSRGMKSYELVQKLQVVSPEKSNNLSENRNFKVITKYLFKEDNNLQTNVSLDIQFKIKDQKEEPDQVMSMFLDHENIPIYSENPDTVKFGKKGSSKYISRTYIIPENLWISIIYSRSIGLKLNFSDEEFQAELCPVEMADLQTFLKMAIHFREVNFPVIPDGKKKW